MVEVYDNFISPEYFKQLQDYVTGSYQQWYYQSNIDSLGMTNQGFGKHGFACYIVRYPNTFTDCYVSGMLSTLVMNTKKIVGCDNILRSRLDLTLHKYGDPTASPHVDSNKPHIASIFYFNNSDGNTVIYNEKYDGEDCDDPAQKIQQNDITHKLTIKKEIEPRQNRLVVFDGLLIHRGHYPCKHDTRILLNSNFN
tara:strand:- start:67 stop:654 length:588 start_codon:yes stop_codon:yes gene_type:complete